MMGAEVHVGQGGVDRDPCSLLALDEPLMNRLVAAMATGSRTYRAQLADVARAAGVSRSTASKILNDVPGLAVKDDTRQRVHEAARRLGYRPHVSARALAGVSARALALLVPELANPAHTEMIRGAFSEARLHGFTVLVAEDFEEQEADENFADLVAAGHVDGIIMGSARTGHPLLADLVKQRIPHVFMNRAVIGSGRNVTMDLTAASRLAVDHLVAHGHTNVGHLAGPRGVQAAEARTASFKTAVNAHHLVSAPICSAPFDERGGATAMTTLLRRYPHVTGVYVSSLRQAVGALHTLRAHNLRVPEDMSVVTYDNLPLTAYLSPPLDALAMPAYELGRAAVRALVDQIDGAAPQDIEICDGPRLVVRGSVVRPRTRSTRPKGGRSLSVAGA